MSRSELENRKGRTRSPARVASLTLGLLLGLMVLLPATTTSVAADRSTDLAEIEALLENRVRYLAGISQFILAKELGLTTIMGKPLDVATDASGSFPASTANVGIGVDPTIHENEPTVAANPHNGDKLVAGSHFFPTPLPEPCVAYRSTDGGETWSAPFAMPQLTGESFCSDPVLAYAPDGSRVYYAYMDIKISETFEFPVLTITEDLDILVSFSDNDGRTWKGPVVALNGDLAIITINVVTGDIGVLDPGFIYDKPWIGTHVAVDDDDDQANRKWVYVTATRFDDFAPFNCHIAFARSGNKAVSWSAPLLLDGSSGGCGNPVVVQGSRPTGGLGKRVLVAWYNSGTDGWLTGNFQIRTRSSANNGGSFGPIVTASTDSFEAPFFLGPFFFYHRWWGTMFPDVEIDPTGSAHIVYTHDPVGAPFPGISASAEDGDIRYITSAGPPYSSWSAPLTLNDDGLVRAQGYAALETSQGEDDDDVRLHVIWEDHRLGPDLSTSSEFECFILGICNSPNLFFDMFYTTLREEEGDDEEGDEAGGWAPSRRVTDASSINDFIFIGDYNDITTADDDLVFGIWTDRRHQTSIFASEDNVWGARLDGGDDEDDDDDDEDD